MSNNLSNQDRANQNSAQPQASSTPSISLPKGGGAIRGIGEKFGANPVTGTGSMTVPISTSPGRFGFGPQLALAYDSGAGNGPFGFGWNLSLPSITRKTNKGLPKYRDTVESDVFILSGAEDLVPAPTEIDGQQHDAFPRTVNGVDYLIQRYRPRIEGLFARIERWTDQATGEIHWRSITRENITTLYGKTAESRITDPGDSGRVFTWLICESYDDKGNAIVYEYAAENEKNVDRTQANERNRLRKANRYLKRIKYGNRTPNRDATTWQATDPTQLPERDWMFEVVFDYGEGHYAEDAPDAQGRIFAYAQIEPPPGSHWPVRQDPFSTYRAGFEVRTYRLCRRVLMIHHFPQELGIADCLVRSTQFAYNESSIASFITGVTQSGYVRQPDQARQDRYLKKSLPPLEFEYSQVPDADELARQPIQEVDAESLENLPYGLDGASYQWVDLDGEGLSGILTEQAGSWFYKRNLSPTNIRQENGQETVLARFAPVELVARKPSLANVSGGQQQFLDLAGDGQIDLVQFARPLSGYYERTQDENWSRFVPFESVPTLAWDDPNLKFVDLTGDAHADILVTEDQVFAWYPSLAEKGFGPAGRVHQALDEEKGPRLIFADGTQSIYLADLSGDGLTDLARIRNGEVCYWPNLGYGRFGAKVAMDKAPWFDYPDQFNQQRVRLADIDGSGTTDIIYLGRDGVDLYFNQAGNSWSKAQTLTHFPRTDNLSSVVAVDLLGNGTACLVWSSPLPGDARQPMRYIDLMGGQKPHLLVSVKNNLGAETRVHYAPSTKFYLADKVSGKPWITKLPFPVHVVESVETYDHISGNRFVTRYAYHHGHFDGEEREFRGFGMVEQFDTEEFTVLAGDGTLPEVTNIDAASHVPPVRTKTWFHTGMYVGRDRVSNFFAGLLDEHDRGEYYREPAWRDDDTEARKRLLPDTVMPLDLTLEEEREACRALKGAMLRQEVYALDGTDKAEHPYTITEQDFTIRVLQHRGGNRHAVFFTHAHEAINYHYERTPADPRIGHALMLEVDEYGNVLKSLAIGYGRRQSPLPEQRDRDKQTTTLITFTDNRFTDIDDVIQHPDHYRTPLPAETRTSELTGFKPKHNAARFSFDEWSRNGFALLASAVEIPYEQTADDITQQKRLIEHVRTLYRKDDLTALSPLGEVEPLALPGESYKLALTPGLLAHVFKRKQAGQPDEDLLPNPAPLLEGKGDDQGGYIAIDGNWWIPSGRAFFDPGANAANPPLTAALELSTARQHFYLPRKAADPFGHSTVVDYDGHDLLVARTRDALGNTVAAANDYRVLQPRLITDPNRNRTAAAFDALGMVVAAAVMGKEGEDLGDLLEDFEPDPDLTVLQDFIADPQAHAASLLGKATTRIVYDLKRYQRAGQPPFAATLARETHFYDPLPAGGLKIQISFSYSDGFGREIQKKIQAEAGNAPQRQSPAPLPTGDIRPGDLVRDAQGKLVQANTPRRWVGTGRTVFNNKGKPVRQYEPFFSATHLYEPEREMTDTGVSPVLFYDPVERVVATLHPNHTYEKVVFDPWQQQTWDVNDTVLVADPKTDTEVGDFFRRLPDADYLPTWHSRRISGGLDSAEQDAAAKAAAHADTPSTAFLDSLGRPFLTVADNGTRGKYETRVELDIEGNQRAVIDAKGRTVMRYEYDMLGNQVRQDSMEAGTRWGLTNVAGNPIYRWDSRNHRLRTTYDELQRPTELFLQQESGAELLVERTVYGEGQGEANNHRGQIFEQFDGAGVVTFAEYDYKGNLLRGQRQFAQNYKTTLDWQTNPALEPQNTFTTSTEYDALNRPTEITTPDDSVTRPTYNEANLLERLDVNLRGVGTATNFVANIDYNARGQRTLIEYGNGVNTSYKYDDHTFRLIDLKTTRASEGDLQNLHYAYDPVGNITSIRDDAQPTIFFNNAVVEPHTDYTYDAVYQLIEAKGREHIGQAGAPHTTWKDTPRFVTGIPHPNQPQAMRRYAEKYEYDGVGNFERLVHQAANGSWTRSYDYDEASQLEPDKKSNRLTSTTIGATTETYSISGDGYDKHGNMLRMPHLPEMDWDYRDQLQSTTKQVVNSGGTPETTWYVYDAAGQRVRKVTERQNGSRQKERLYLGGFEIYREYNGSGNTVTLERETLHIMDDQQRIALVETKTFDNGLLPRLVSLIRSPTPLIRYQFGNHLGSASLELDDQAQIISYEEYTAYGSTSYQAVRSTTEVSKRYRYTGKERDEESGFYYHGARHYAPWLGRWVSADPAGLVDGGDLYLYGKNDPIRYTDESGLEAEVRLHTEHTGDVKSQKRIKSEFMKTHKKELETLFEVDVVINTEKGTIAWKDPDKAFRRFKQLEAKAEQRVEFANKSLPKDFDVTAQDALDMLHEIFEIYMPIGTQVGKAREWPLRSRQLIITISDREFVKEHMGWAEHKSNTGHPDSDPIEEIELDSTRNTKQFTVGINRRRRTLKKGARAHLTMGNVLLAAHETQHSSNDEVKIFLIGMVQKPTKNNEEKIVKMINTLRVLLRLPVRKQHGWRRFDFEFQPDWAVRGKSRRKVKVKTGAGYLQFIGYGSGKNRVRSGQFRVVP